MTIYNINEPSYLDEDIQELIERIQSFYELDLQKDKLLFKSKIVDKENHWASSESDSKHNKIIPKIKSLHKDMYSLIEAIYKHKNDGSFDRTKLAETYPDFDKFRMLNNQFKHFTGNSIVIDLIALRLIDGSHHHKIDIMCQFKHPDCKLDLIQYTEFIGLFLSFLKDYELIRFNPQ